MPQQRRSDLFAELAELCANFQDNSGLVCRVAVDERHTRFDGEAREVVYRAVRELLANVQRHARATEVEISTSVGDDGVLKINVWDNGIGLPPERRKLNPLESGAIGLWSIDHRLTSVGGTLEIRQQAGTKATISLPAPWLLP